MEEEDEEEEEIEDDEGSSTLLQLLSLSTFAFFPLKSGWIFATVSVSPLLQARTELEVEGVEEATVLEGEF